jgi:hypothetical protein
MGQHPNKTPAPDRPRAQSGQNPKTRFEFDRQKTLENQGARATIPAL